MATNTPRLNLPLVKGSDIVNKSSINTSIESVDEKVAPITHVKSAVHWSAWKASVPVVLKDIIRLDEMYSWGYLECTKAGMTGATQPTCPYGEGDKVTDGTAEWTLKRIGGGTAGDFCTKKQAIAYAIALG